MEIFEWKNEIFYQNFQIQTVIWYLKLFYSVSDSLLWESHVIFEQLSGTFWTAISQIFTNFLKIKIFLENKNTFWKFSSLFWKFLNEKWKFLIKLFKFKLNLVSELFQTAIWQPLMGIPCYFWTPIWNFLNSIFTNFLKIKIFLEILNTIFEKI